MRLIPGRLGNDWNKQIDGIVGSRRPLTDAHDYNPDFPWEEVQDCTTQYVISKKARPIPGLSDERLIKLVQKSDKKDVALAACVHLLSPPAVRTLMVGDFARLSLVAYLQLICIGHHGSPGAVGELEADRAKAILLATHFDTSIIDGRYLKALFDIIQKGIPKASLVYAVFQTAAATAVAAAAVDLSILRQRYEWHRAWKVISWLSAIPSTAVDIPANYLDPIELLDRNFPAWRMWAAWEPIGSQSLQYKCSDMQLGSLRDFLALNGPDDQPEPKANVFQRLISQDFHIKSKVARIGNIWLRLDGGTQKEAAEMLDRVFRCSDIALHVGPIQADIFIILLVGADITTDSLDVLEPVLKATERSVVLQVCAFYKAVRYGSANTLQSAKLTLPLLRTPGCERLRVTSFGKLVVETLVKEIEGLQDTLRSVWESLKTQTDTCVEESTIRQLHSAVATLRDESDVPWLSGLVGEPFMELVRNWPPLDDVIILLDMKWALDLTQVVSGGSRGSAERLIVKNVRFLQDLFLKRGSIDPQSRSMMRAVLDFWKTLPDGNRKEAVVLLTDGEGKFRIDCIDKIHLLSDLHVRKICKILRFWNDDKPGSQDFACDELAILLTDCEAENAHEIVGLWRPVLYRMLKQRGAALLGEILQYWAVDQYVAFLCNIQEVFRGKVLWNPKLSPPILDPSIHQWACRLNSHLPVLRRLQARKGSTAAIRCFKAGLDPWTLEGILCHLKLEECCQVDTPMYELSHEITYLLSTDAGNAWDVYEVLCSVFQMTPGGAAACIRLLELCNKGQTDVASLLLCAWQQDSSWSEDDQIGFRDTGRFLRIGNDGVADVSTTALEKVATYMDALCAELFLEARRLDSMRIGLKYKDSEGISQFLYDNNIEDTTTMEDCIARLPVELLNVVESVDFSEVEILFPLSEVTPLQRAAMGIGTAQSLLIRLYIGDFGSPPKFCIHLDNEPRLDSHDVHSLWVVSPGTMAPELPICHGKITPATYQLARILSRFLAKGFQDIHSVHTLISKSLKAMGHECIICGALHGTTLRRATVCHSELCSYTFSQSLTDIRLANIREDPLAVDMLLTTIKSAITSGYHDILPNCPFDQITCLSILQTLPAMVRLGSSRQLWGTIPSWHNGKSEEFLTWAICNFRGFLSTATGNLRIPSLPPGTLQFVLANASPLKELAFESELTASSQNSRVMFHGTSLDRLYLILAQGLKVLSGTSLQSYGAARGSGIYLAEDPTVAFGYSINKGAKNSNWTNSAIKLGRIILACELAAPLATSADGVYVAQNEGSVMVRYIFVVPSSTPRLPISGHVAPALMSVYKSLRSGAL